MHTKRRKADRNLTDRPTGRTGDRRAWLVLLIIPAGILVYANSFAGVFIFDDVRHIEFNERIRQLWPITPLLTARRPVVEVSLAVDYAIGQLHVWGYHAFNLGVHLLAGLVLFGVIRRTLLGERLKSSYGPSALWLALAASLVWLVHPLQTQGVTYIVQRGESLMALFYVLTLYCVIRGAASSRRWAWYAAAVVACALGMGSKAVMVTAPFVVLLYDWIFLARSLRRALRARWVLYAGLAATWLVLLACGEVQDVFNTDPGQRPAVGFGYKEVTPLEYARTQPGVIVHYIRLCFWPASLCLDYGWPVARNLASIVVCGAAIVLLLAATAWALWRRPALGFLGACFFLILSPTSSFIPIMDLAFEHRMYLPSAAVLILVVLGVHRLGRMLVTRWPTSAVAVRWLAGGLTGVIVVALGLGTAARNRVYQDAVVMWRDVIAKRPQNKRALNNLAVELAGRGEYEEALALSQRAVELDPEYSQAYMNVGQALFELGRYEEAIEAYRKCIEFGPDAWYHHYYLGVALAELGRGEEAVAEFRKALAVDPEAYEVRFDLARLLRRQGRLDEAAQEFREVVRQRPRHVQAGYQLGLVLQELGRLADAVDAYRRVLTVDGDDTEVRCSLASALGMLGRRDEAIEECRRVLRINPQHVGARDIMGIALYQQGRLAEAIATFQEALRLDPSNVDVRFDLGTAFTAADRLGEAIEEYRRILAIQPDHARARQMLAVLMRMQGSGEE
jgi:tetratricopeptide (TPR) repeat protein